MKRWISTCIALGMTITAGSTFGEERDGMLLQVLTTQQEYDPLIPWQKQRPVTKSGYGVIVGPGLVLTTEHLVRNAALVELFAPRAAQSIPGTVLIADSQVNLALIAARSLDGNPVFRTVEATDRTDAERAFEVVQLDGTRGVQRGSATELRAEVSALPWSPHASLMHTLLVDHAVGGEGAPVLQDGKLAGIVMRYDAGQRTADMLPCGVIRQFMEDAAEPPYNGFAAAGFIWRQLVDPWKRAWLGVDKETGGILVLACIPGSGADSVLQPNDVILSWAGAPIDELGFYNDPDFGRLLFPHLIKGRRLPGDTIRVDIVRHGARQSRNMTLTRVTEESMLIPENTEGTREEYLVEGGFVIRELSGRYLQAHGSNWRKDVDAALVQLYLTRQYYPERPGQRVLILSRVLPHPINVGYQHYFNQIITHVNQTPVENLEAVFEVRRRDGHIHRLTLRAEGVDLVLDRDKIAEANASLQRLYDIPALFWMRRRDAQPSGSSK